MKVSINTQPFVEAYRKVGKSNLAQHTTVTAHTIVLETDYLDKNIHKILKSIKSVAKRQETAAIQSFIGQLALKLPGAPELGELDLHNRVLCKLCISKLIVEILTFNGYLSVKNEIRSIMKHGRRTHVEVPYIECGGEKVKRSLRTGLSNKPVVNQKYVNGRKLSSEMKQYLLSKSQMRFKVSHWCNEEIVRTGFMLSKDFQFREKTITEREAKRNRYDELVKFAVSMVGTVHHLPMKFDDRLREYYEFQTQGLRPQGKLWETLMWDLAEPEIITDEGAEHIKHMLYCLKYGKTPIELMDHSKDVFEWANNVNPFAANDDDEFGELLLINKLADAYDYYVEGKPCPYLFGMDLTNSGLIMASCLFKSSEMADACNLGSDKSTVADSHTTFRDAYDLDISRNDIKPIHTALLHGGSNFTLQKQLSQLGVDVSLVDIDDYNRNAYGDCVSNIEILAQWGKELMDNHRSSVSWKTPDEFVAHHKAFIESVPVSVRCVTPSNKKLWCESTVVTDTPLKYHADGQLAYGYGYGGGSSSKSGTVPHIRGLYANIVHSFDAYCLREVTRKLDDLGLNLMSKHDDYMVHPNHIAAVKKSLQDTFDDLRGSDYLDRALNDIVSAGDFVKPEVVYGTWEDTIDNGNFLMP